MLGLEHLEEIAELGQLKGFKANVSQGSELHTATTEFIAEHTISEVIKSCEYMTNLELIDEDKYKAFFLASYGDKFALFLFSSNKKAKKVYIEFNLIDEKNEALSYLDKFLAYTKKRKNYCLKTLEKIDNALGFSFKNRLKCRYMVPDNLDTMSIVYQYNNALMNLEIRNMGSRYKLCLWDEEFFYSFWMAAENLEDFIYQKYEYENSGTIKRIIEKVPSYERKRLKRIVLNHIARKYVKPNSRQRRVQACNG